MPESRAKTTNRFDTGGAVARRAEPRCAPWTSWARSLIDKYEPVKQRHNSLAMTLVRPFTTIRLMRERWQLATRELKPQINLLIHPNLRISQWHLLAGVSNFGDVRHEGHERNYSLTLAAGSLQRIMLSGDHVRYGSEPALATRSSPSLDDTTRRRAIDETSRVHWSKQILENADALAQRLLTHTRRVEERIEGLATLTLRQISATAERQTASTKPPVDEPTPQVRMAAYGGAATSMQAEFGGRGIDVEQLTDRVIRELDRRVVAVRERRGRI